uniref:Uncharacterized protein n=1 Tax=Anguilla anguilla TaxID=7936 RepID=A0A0E9S7M4_ANGAN
MNKGILFFMTCVATIMWFKRTNKSSKHEMHLIKKKITAC